MDTDIVRPLLPPSIAVVCVRVYSTLDACGRRDRLTGLLEYSDHLYRIAWTSLDFVDTTK